MRRRKAIRPSPRRRTNSWIKATAPVAEAVRAASAAYEIKKGNVFRSTSSCYAAKACSPSITSAMIRSEGFTITSVPCTMAKSYGLSPARRGRPCA